MTWRWVAVPFGTYAGNADGDRKVDRLADVVTYCGRRSRQFLAAHERFDMEEELIDRKVLDSRAERAHDLSIFLLRTSYQ
jgi:hypothetical protein